MQLSFGEYEQLRTHPNPFVVLPGHVWRKRSSGSSRSTRTMSSWRSSVPARSARLSTIRANPNAPSELGGRLLHRAAELDGAAVRARLQTRRFGCDADLFDEHVAVLGSDDALVPRVVFVPGDNHKPHRV